MNTDKAERIPSSEKAERIIDALRIGGPASMEALIEITGLSFNQFVAGWQYVKKHRAEDLGLVPIYDPGTNTYGLWEESPEVWRGSSNRLEDLMTRYEVLTSSLVHGMAAIGMMTPRWRRAMEMSLDELETQMEHYRRYRDAEAERVEEAMT